MPIQIIVWKTKSKKEWNKKGNRRFQVKIIYAKEHGVEASEVAPQHI